MRLQSIGYPLVTHSTDTDDQKALNAAGSAPSGTERRQLLQRLMFLPSAAAILLVRCYQLVLSPLLGRTCRFYPSCSQYYIAAVTKYGLLPGTWRGIRRISRCHPWNPGGYDPP